MRRRHIYMYISQKLGRRERPQTPAIPSVKVSIERPPTSKLTGGPSLLQRATERGAEDVEAHGTSELHAELQPNPPCHRPRQLALTAWKTLAYIFSNTYIYSLHSQAAPLPPPVIVAPPVPAQSHAPEAQMQRAGRPVDHSAPHRCQ